MKRRYKTGQYSAVNLTPSYQYFIWKVLSKKGKEKPLGLLKTARLYKPDELFHFDMALIGEALEHLAIIILAWRRALLRGIGKHEGQAELVNYRFLKVAEWENAIGQLNELAANSENSLKVVMKGRIPRPDSHLQSLLIECERQGFQSLASPKAFPRTLF